MAVRLDEAAVGEDFAGGVLDGEVDPGFIEVALLGNEGVGDALVLDNHICDEGLAGGDGKGSEAEGSDESGVFRFQGEDVDVKDAGVLRAVLEEGFELLGLLFELVEPGDEGVAAQPAMGDEFAILGTADRRRPQAWARAACGRFGRWKRSPCGRRAAGTAW